MTPEDRIEKIKVLLVARIKALRTMWAMKNIHVIMRDGLLKEARKIITELNQLKAELKAPPGRE